MSNPNDQGLSDFDWIPVELTESDHYSLISEQESTANEFHLTGTTNNAAASSEIRRPTADTFGVVELTHANAREYNHFLEDVTTKPIQHKVIPRVSQAARVDTSSENAGRSVGGTDDQASKLERKRMNDRAYRQRCKESKRKIEGELEDLRKQNAALKKKLHKLELKPDGDHQQNASEQYCKMEFCLDCYDDESRAEAMKIVGGVTGMKRVSMDIEENKLTLHGKDIDPLPLQSKLKKICNARLLSFSIEAKIDHENNEGKIMVERDCMVVARNSALVAQNSVPASCTASYSYPFSHIASAYPNGGPPEECFNLTRAAIFFLIFLIVVLAFACCVLYFR